MSRFGNKGEGVSYTGKGPLFFFLIIIGWTGKELICKRKDLNELKQAHGACLSPCKVQF